MKALPVFLVFISSALAQTLRLPPTCAGRPTVSVSANAAYDEGVTNAPSYDVCWLRVGSAKGNPDATAILGALTLTGEADGGPNLQEGIRLLKQSLRYGSRQGMAMISQAYTTGWGGFPKDAELARQWEAAADRKGPVPITPVGEGLPAAPPPPIREVARDIHPVPPPSSTAQPAGISIPPTCAGQSTADVPGDKAFNLGVRGAPNYNVCWLRVAAAKSDWDATAILGILTLEGRLIPSNLQEGTRLLKESLGHGSRQAMWMVSRAYASGMGGFPKDLELSRDWEAASELKGPVPTTPVGARSGNDNLTSLTPPTSRSVPRQPGRAAQVCDPRNPISSGDSGYLYRVAHNYPDGSPQQACYLRQSAELGEYKAQYEVAESLRATGDPARQKEALEWYIKAGDNGKSEGYDKAAEMYEKGIGVPAASNKAALFHAKAEQTRRDQQFGSAVASRTIDVVNKVYESDEQRRVDRLEQQGCKLGYATSEQFSSGAALDESEALRKKDKRDDALCWANIALVKGDKQAYRQIGIVLADRGTDQQKGFAWLLKTAESGDTRVYYAIGSSYDTGSGVEQNPEEAFRWYRLAAINQDPPFNYLSMQKIAALYRDGRGVVRNSRLAEEWADKAKNQEAAARKQAR